MNSSSPSYHGYRCPSEIISHTVWLYHRFCMSFRDVEDLLAQRGSTVGHRQAEKLFGGAGLLAQRQLESTALRYWGAIRQLDSTVLTDATRTPALDDLSGCQRPSG